MDKLVKLLMRIAETKPYLKEYLGKPLEVQLLRQAKIRSSRRNKRTRK